MNSSKVFTLLLILGAILLQSVDSNLVKRRSRIRRDVTYCKNLVPGVQKLAAGVDITKLDLNHDYSAGSIDGLKSNVIQFTCSQGQTFQVGSGSYDQPDQAKVININSGVSAEKTETIYTLQKMKEKMALDVEVDVTTLKGSFSGSFSYTKTQEQMKNLSSFITSMDAHATTTRADLSSPLELQKSLDEGFEAYIEELNGPFEQNRDQYMEIVEAYGTHYFAYGQFGGTFSFYSIVNNDVRNTLSDEEIEASAEADFKKILNAKGAYNQSINKVREEYSENRRVFQRYFGGQTNLLEDKSYKDWWPTVAKNPWLTQAKIAPLTDLVTDPTKKAGLQKAIDLYLVREYLKDLKRIMNDLSETLRDSSEKTKDLIRKIDIMLNDKKPDIGWMQSVADEVETYVLTPKWFLQNVKIHLKYRSGGQCNEHYEKLEGLPNQLIPNRPLSQKAVKNCLTEFMGTSTRGETDRWFNVDKLKLRFADPYIDYKYENPYNDHPLWLKATKFCAQGRYYNQIDKQYHKVEGCINPGHLAFNTFRISAPNSNGFQDGRVILRSAF